MLALAPSTGLFGQNPDAPVKELDELAAIYSKNLKPYLLQFAKLQVPPTMDSCEQPRYQAALLTMYEIKEEYVLKELCRLAKSQKREHYISSFSRTYRFEFPGLDYAYFKNVKQRLRI